MGGVRSSILIFNFLAFLALSAAAERSFEDKYIQDLLGKVLRINYGYRQNRRDLEDQFENWKGRWMPSRPDEPPLPPKIYPTDPLRNGTDDYVGSNIEVHEMPHGVRMGEPSVHCDDGKTNLTVDWDGSPVNYTCYDLKIVPDRRIRAIQYCETIPKNYVAIHKCMRDEIEYDTELPVYGTHRPLWPIYGEYKFLPKQRWLHSLEHGAVAMLYHPCANPMEVKKLKALVTGCLRRHVISPYNLLSEDRPLALLTWGCRLTMSYVDPELVKRFIQRNALRGPEQIPRDGDFDDQIISKAKMVSDLRDSVLCP